MPLEYHAAHSNGVLDIAGSKEIFGLVSLRRKLASTKESNNASPSLDADGNHNQARGYYGLRDNQRYGYLVAIKYYGTVFLKVIITIKLIDLPDNFDGY
jgi:hypothetical protein